MPRRNSNNAQDTSNRRRGRGAGPRPQPIDWELYGSGAESKKPTRSTRVKEPAPINEFTRRLIGFRDTTLDLLIQHGFEKIDENGGIPILFTGISQAPRKQIGYNKPTAVKTRGGLMVISGIVEAGNANELGRGTGSIRQTEVPDIDSHNSSKRFNVAVGYGDKGLEERELARALIGDSALVLSGVASINGENVGARTELDYLWNRPMKDSSYSSWRY